MWCLAQNDSSALVSPLSGGEFTVQKKRTLRSSSNDTKRPLTAEETKIAHTLLIRIASIAVGVWTVALSVIYFVL